MSGVRVVRYTLAQPPFFYKGMQEFAPRHSASLTKITVDFAQGAASTTCHKEDFKTINRCTYCLLPTLSQNSFYPVYGFHHHQ